MSRRRKLLVVVPTRNRPAHVRIAVHSVLRQSDGLPVEVVVSDNSDPNDARLVAEWCDQLGDPRCRRIAPPRPLGMADHWNWMLEQCLGCSDFTHCTLLSDRTIFRQGAMRALCDAIAAEDADIIAYVGGDTIFDDRQPIVIWEQSWTGRRYSQPSRDLLDRAARSEFPSILPKLMTSVATRRLLEEIKRDSGRIIPDTISPDYGFAFDSLLRRESIVVLDMPLTAGFGIATSNGFAFARGWYAKAAASRDFLAFAKPGKNAGAVPGLHLETPLPNLQNAVNGMVHEYVVTRNAGHENDLAPLDTDSYLRVIGASVMSMENRSLRRTYLRMLEDKGWRPPAPTLRGLVDHSLYRARNLLNRIRRGPPRSFASAEAAIDHAYHNYGPRIEAGAAS